MSNPETTAIIEQLLTEHQPADVPGFARKKHGIIVSYARVREIYRASAKRLGRVKVNMPNQLPRMMPDDFAEHAAVEGTKRLRARYGCSIDQITRWRRESGVAPPPQLHQRRLVAPNKKMMPEDFVKVAPTMTITALRERYNVGQVPVLRWLEEAGLSCAQIKVSRRTNYAPGPIDRPHRDITRTGEAADYLRRFGPVIRCNERGNYDPSGKLYRRGRIVLTGEEIIARAQHNGWNPDAWRALPAQPLQHSGASA